MALRRGTNNNAKYFPIFLVIWNSPLCTRPKVVEAAAFKKKKRLLVVKAEEDTHSTLYLVIAHQRERLVVSSVASKLAQTQFPKCLKRCNITNMAKLTTSTSGGMSPTASLAPAAPPSQTAITPLPPPASSKDHESKDLESNGDNLKEVLVVSPREAIVISSTSTTNQKDNDDCDPETATQTTTTTTILVAKTIHNEVSNSAVTSNDISECTCGVKKGLLYEETV